MSPWIEAMRLRTLPVSCAGVVAATALLTAAGALDIVPVLLCLCFAVLAQIASNFANEYYDYRAGLDRPGREGPRRGVTEGDITPGAMRRATFLTLALACAVGCTLIAYGGWWLIAAGAVIALGALAYSAGPWPLSRHALGEVAVVIFFGIVPVNLTFYVSAGSFDETVAVCSLAIGLMAANILVVNNYRDIKDDEAGGKHTLATMLGPRFASSIYLFNGYIAVALMIPMFFAMPPLTWIAPALYLVVHTLLWACMTRLEGSRLNPILGLTAMTMLGFTIIWAIEMFIVYPPADIF